MTTQIQTQVTATTQGRPLSKRGQRTKNAVLRFVSAAPASYTSTEVRRYTKQSKVSVRNRLNALMASGQIEQVGTAPNASGRGRPQAVYATVENTYRSKANVVANRKKVREYAATTPAARLNRVATTLIALYGHQVEDEKEARDSRYLNAQGFTKYDALRGTKDAERYLQTGSLPTEAVNYWLTPVGNAGRPRIDKYHRQA